MESAIRQRQNWKRRVLIAVLAAAPFAPVLTATEPDSRPRPTLLPSVTPRFQPVVKAVGHTSPLRWAVDPSGGQQSNVQLNGSVKAAKKPSRWLRSSTSSSATEVSRRLIAQASQEYSVGAWLSAETSAWEAMRWAAKAVDFGGQENGVSGQSSAMSTQLNLALQTIREARDFSDVTGNTEFAAVARLARSHQTDLLDDQTPDVSSTEASDRYLDAARIKLAPIAERSVEAAQAMDLLASIYLSRAESSTLPSATALCLRRAALQGQPNNSSLASRLGMHLSDVGLLEEARWALEHSMSLEPTQSTSDALVNVLRQMGRHDEAAGLIATSRRRFGALRNRGPAIRVPEITHLSPTEFAALSKPVVWAVKPGETVAAPTPVVPTQTRTAKPASSPIGSVSWRRPGSSDDDARVLLAGSRSNVRGRAATTLAAIERTSSKADGNPDTASEAKPGALRRMIGSLKRIW